MTDRNSLLKSAQKHLASGKIHQAIEEYLKLLKENPRDFDLMTQIGDLYYKANHFTHAFEYFEKAANYYLTKGFTAKGIALYRRMIKLRPNDPEIPIRLAELYYRSGQSAEGRNELQQAIDRHLQSGDRAGTVSLMNALLEMEPENPVHQWAQARIFEKLEMNSQAAAVYLRIGTVMAKKGSWKESRSLLEKAHSLSPRNITVVWELLRVVVEIHQSEPGADVERFVDTVLSEDGILALATESLSPGQFEQMHELLDRAIAAAPGKVLLRVLKGELRWKQGNVDAAFCEFLRATEDTIQHGDPDHGISLCNRMTQMDCSFCPAWEKLVELHTHRKDQENLLSSYSSLADAYISRTRYAEAGKCLDMLIEMDPHNSSYREKREFVCSLDLQSPGDPELDIFSSDYVGVIEIPTDKLKFALNPQSTIDPELDIFDSDYVGVIEVPTGNLNLQASAH